MAESLLKVEGQWKLSKYARFLRTAIVTGDGSGSGESSRGVGCSGAVGGAGASGGAGDIAKKDGDWKILDASNAKPLSLSLLRSGSLLIHHGREILENHSLINRVDKWRAVCKGDSILFAYKINEETRKFRIMLAASEVKSGAQYCKILCQHLTGYLTIKDISPDCHQVGQGDVPIQGEEESTRMEGVVTIPNLARCIATPKRVSNRGTPYHLPLAYSQQKSAPSTAQLNSYIRLCLSDSAFPAFVGQVEKQLLRIIEDDKK